MKGIMSSKLNALTQSSLESIGAFLCVSINGDRIRLYGSAGTNQWRLSVATTKLTAKQEFFCKEYLIDLNATQAAIRAGYSEKTAKDMACQN